MLLHSSSLRMSREDVSVSMRDFAKKYRLLKKPTKTLFCSYFAEKIMMATPLLSWLLNKGLTVTKAEGVDLANILPRQAGVQGQRPWSGG